MYISVSTIDVTIFWSLLLRLFIYLLFCRKRSKDGKQKQSDGLNKICKLYLGFRRDEWE